jgi:hypothetical protein
MPVLSQHSVCVPDKGLFSLLDGVLRGNPSLKCASKSLVLCCNSDVTRFSEGIAIGLSARLPAERIRALFHRAMESIGNTPPGPSDLARKDETLEPDNRS